VAIKWCATHGMGYYFEVHERLAGPACVVDSLSYQEAHLLRYGPEQERGIPSPEMDIGTEGGVVEVPAWKDDAVPIVDDREAIPQEEMETLWINAFRVIGPVSDEVALELGRGIIRWLQEREGYPKRVYVKVVAS